MKKSTAVVALGALAQETRLDIFRLLVAEGPDGLPAGEIGSRLRLPSPTLSFHLNQLRYAGLVTSRRESRSIIYAANYKTMNGVLGYLTENCCRGQPELCSPANGCAQPAQASLRRRPVGRREPMQIAAVESEAGNSSSHAE
jgi:ArsR family transcriptional regulator, arsenate/arsenite/antimonite-responsive transcriptional repressor